MPGFLTPADIQELTGIKTGKNGQKREQLQVAYLREKGIPFTENIKGAPIVTWAAIEGTRSLQPAANQGWQSNVLSIRKSA
jgi:hypothetical protein